MAFDPNKHLMKLKGKDYLPVAARLVWFREDCPDGRIETEHIEITDQRAVFRATVTKLNAEGVVLGTSTGYGSETPKDFGDYIEKAETKSIGRALAALGYGTAFAPEFDEGARIVDTPQQQRPQAAQRSQDAPKPANATPDKGKVMARLHALANDAGLSHDDLRALVLAKVDGIESMNDAPVDVLVDLGKRLATDPAPLKQWLAKQAELLPGEDVVPNPDRFTS